MDEESSHENGTPRKVIDAVFVLSLGLGSLGVGFALGVIVGLLPVRGGISENAAAALSVLTSIGLIGGGFALVSALCSFSWPRFIWPRFKTKQPGFSREARRYIQRARAAQAKVKQQCARLSTLQLEREAVVQAMAAHEAAIVKSMELEQQLQHLELLAPSLISEDDSREDDELQRTRSATSQ